MNHIGVLNFTRMGDLIQCGPLLDSLRKRAHGTQLTLIVLENFEETARRLPMVDDVITFPLDRFVPRLDHRHISLADIYTELSEFASTLRERHFDCFYNLAHTRLSAALTWLIHAPTSHGLTYDNTGHLLVTNPWINYYFHVTLDRTWNPFNLVEMYLPIAEETISLPSLSFRVSSEDDAQASTLLKRGTHGNSPLIAFQMGAAETRRQWPTEAFVELAHQLIASHNAQIVTLGTAEDAVRNQHFATKVNSEHVLELSGKTTVGSLAAVLKRCRVLISNDTGTIHLAAAMNTPTVGIYLGPAAAKDTGPYGDGHLLLEPRMPCAPCAYQSNCAHRVCHESVRPTDVAAAVRWQLERASRSSLQNREWSRLKIRRTEVTTDGNLRLIPLTRLPLDRQTLFLSFYRVFWPLLLENHSIDQTMSMGSWIAEEEFLDEHFEVSDLTALLIHDDNQAIEVYKKIAKRAESAMTILMRELKSSHPSLRSLREMTLELAGVDQELLRLEEDYPTWAPLAQFIRVLRGNVPDDSHEGLADACRDVYGTFVRGTNLLTTLWNEITHRQREIVEMVHA